MITIKRKQSVDARIACLNAEIARALEEATVKLTRLAMLVKDHNVDYTSPAGNEWNQPDLEMWSDNLNEISAEFQGE